MATTKGVLDELLKGYRGPDDFYGPGGPVKQLGKALAERATQAELAGQIAYEKSGPGGKPAANRRNGKPPKALRAGQGPMEIGIPRGREGECEP
jgi:transposase-like protein